MLKSAKPSNGFLIGPSIKKANLKRSILFEFWQINGIDVLLTVVVIVTVTSQAAQQHTLVFVPPAIDCQHNKSLIDRPGIWKRRDE